jgi:drug/metabolite transporter (DMT)-like permease
MANWEAILLGLGLGVLAACVLALFLVFSRPLRRVRNPLVLGLGYLVVGASGIGSLVALLMICDRFGVGRNDPQHYNALYAHAISYGCGVFGSGWGEVAWRKSVGLDDKSLQAQQNKKL